MHLKNGLLWAAALFGAVLACSARERAFAQAAPTVACFDAHCDTQLDIMHANITASLIGCSPQKSDLVLVNGKRQDGILWKLVGIAPATAKSLDARWSEALAIMHRASPMTFPTVIFRLKPGYYRSLTLSVGKCSFGPFSLATTDSGASGDRHLILVEGRGTAASGVGGVYGYMPLPDLQIALHGVTSGETLVARDEIDPSPLGDTYMFFFDAVKPGRYTLSVSGVGWERSLREVVVDKPDDLVGLYIHDSELGL